MSFDHMPSKTEVMGWSPAQLADYLRRMDLSGSDKVVTMHSMNGSRFVNMSENDLQRFPKLQAPMISKIWSEINKKEEKRGLFWKKPAVTQSHEPDTRVDNQGWADEFDTEDEDDDDYEEPDDAGSERDYESPMDDDEDGPYEPPPTQREEEQITRPRPRVAEGDYIDNRNSQISHHSGPPAVSPRPPAHSSLSRPLAEPSPPRRDPSPHCAGRHPARVAGPPQIRRDKKPRDSGINLSAGTGHIINMTDTTVTQPRRPPFPPSSSSTVTRSNSSARPSPNRFVTDIRNDAQTQNEGHVPRHHTFPLQKSLPLRPGLPGPPQRHDRVAAGGSLPPVLKLDLRSSSKMERQTAPPPPTYTQDLAKCWYVGKVGRREAEDCLRRFNKDGAYLVRDSTKAQGSQPYTLMVLFQQKVFNIQIRLNQDQYQLGTGLKVQETFPTVSDIIRHYSQSPLLLIDAKNPGSGQQNMCLLSEPAGQHQANTHSRS